MAAADQRAAENCEGLKEVHLEELSDVFVYFSDWYISSFSFDVAFET